MIEALPDEAFLGDLVLWWRKRRGLTRNEFARRLGVRESRAWSLENKPRMFTLPTIVSVTKAFEISIDQFFNEGTPGVIAARAAGELERSHKRGRGIKYPRARCEGCGQLVRRKVVAHP